MIILELVFKMIKSSPGKKGEDIPGRTKGRSKAQRKKGGGNFKEGKFSEAEETE